MRSTHLLRRWIPVAAAVVITAVVVRFFASPVQAQPAGAEPYRAELVHNDPYKVQSALNSMAKEGWYFVSSASRNDSKVLLIFRKSN